MAYTLTDASALGLDLARTPGGVEAAQVLLRVLLAGPRDVAAPVSPGWDLERSRARARDLVGPGAPTVLDLTAVEDAAEARRVEQSGPGAGAGPGAGPADDLLAQRLRRVVRRLGAVSFGSVDDLLGLAGLLAREVAAGCDDVLTDGLVEDVGQVVVDAVLGALTRHRPDPAAPVLARALGHRLDPPRPARPVLPPLLPPGRALLAAGLSPLVAGTAGLLGRLAASEERVLLLDDRPPPHLWAEHMHEAAWAVETTGRTRLAAAAQLELLRCLDAAGVSPGAYLGGVWNTCSAAVQAQVVVDVLSSRTHEVLCADLLAALPG